MPRSANHSRTRVNSANPLHPQPRRRRRRSTNGPQIDHDVHRHRQPGWLVPRYRTVFTQRVDVFVHWQEVVAHHTHMRLFVPIRTVFVTVRQQLRLYMVMAL